eukprot:CAMPEP_0185825182 /NCGR_PEP_ID=MMETSP1322-20130828/30737_1 /TAXON_ID=265543 /ORGANISM="Minutocellus polymorphus, Strain RCC2270" /LENGTH=59 /DNA_ID=CAMNT_0028522885 /DNA_START=1 /DNA_END=180 /DNA_ORIENTATION=-
MPVKVVLISGMLVVCFRMVRNQPMDNKAKNGKHSWCRSGAKSAVMNILQPPTTDMRRAG